MTPEQPSEHPFALPGAGLRDFSLEKVKKTSSTDVDSMSQDELLELRDKIEARLEDTSLLDVNLVKESLLQLRRAKKLQEDASTDDKTPMNQRAQVQNSIGNIIKDLGKVQMELYDSEYIKRLQAVVIKVVKQLPKAQQEMFFDLLDHEMESVQLEMGEQPEDAATTEGDDASLVQ